MENIKKFENFDNDNGEKTSISIEMKIDGKVIPHVSISTKYTKDNSDINGLGKLLKIAAPNADYIRVIKMVYNNISSTWMEMDAFEHYNKTK